MALLFWSTSFILLLVSLTRYRICEFDCCVYTHVFKYGKFILLLLYMDDMLIACQDMSKFQELKTLHWREFDMKDLGPTQKILGMEIKRDCEAGKLWLSQGKYIVKDEMSKVTYARAIRCLMCSMVCTHPNLPQAISVVSMYMANSGKQHWNTVKWIPRYLKGTKNFGILFERQQEKACVSGYMDSDYARDLDKRRFTTPYVLACGGELISWRAVL
ncbi:unnamed protein product [Prunus armeniaca]